MPSPFFWRKIFPLLLCFLGGINVATAQENLVPLPWNTPAQKADKVPRPQRKAASLSLPFFEDFVGMDLYPNPDRWVTTREVYLNNTMGVNPVAQGVCTFDALGPDNRPYDTTSAFRVFHADTLAVQPFDLSPYTPGDSIYLSFFVQPQGAGFSPETDDSLMLFFLNRNGRWNKIWAKEGTTLQPFRQVLLPVTDTSYLYDGFRFRFINIASINLNDDVWNLDYIRMNAGRNANDTAVQDVAMSTLPGNLLRDYTAMPYRHYAAKAATETGASINGFVRNNNSQSGPGSVTLNAVNDATGASASVYTNSQSVSLAGYSTPGFSIPFYRPSVSIGPTSPLIIHHQFHIASSLPNASTANDTLTKDQIFDNYFAYDDGTAEQAYYLNLFASLPGKVAMEFHTNVPDTMRGAAILFGQQVPTSANKFFTMQLYSSLAGVNGATADVLLHEQDFYQPRFVDTVNRFFYYTFTTPVIVPAGTYYFCSMQPALSGSDSLYYAVDVNRVGGNHLYYNVDGTWQSSAISGVLMMRPLFGASVAPTAVESVFEEREWSLYPNPSTGELRLQNVPQNSFVQLLDLTGREARAPWRVDENPDLSQFSPGTYLLRWKGENGLWSAPKKWLLMR